MPLELKQLISPNDRSCSQLSWQGGLGPERSQEPEFLFKGNHNRRFYIISFQKFSITMFFHEDIILSLNVHNPDQTPLLWQQYLKQLMAGMLAMLYFETKTRTLEKTCRAQLIILKMYLKIHFCLMWYKRDFRIIYFLFVSWQAHNIQIWSLKGKTNPERWLQHAFESA